MGTVKASWNANGFFDLAQRASDLTVATENSIQLKVTAKPANRAIIRRHALSGRIITRFMVTPDVPNQEREGIVAQPRGERTSLSPNSLGAYRPASTIP